MKKENGYWIDQNNNKWLSDYYSEDEANRAAKSLKYCIDCTDCIGCTGCIDCNYCIGCTGCNYCTGCTGCTDCTGCIDCNYCTGCTSCTDCIDCKGCTDCKGCKGFEDNPQVFRSGRIGSRNRQTSVYWLGSKIQIRTGCFNGNLQNFCDAVKKKYENQPDHEYFKLIETIKILTGAGQ